MELGAIAENHPIPLASDEGTDPNLGEPEKMWDDRPFSLCDVLDGKGNNRTPPPKL